MPTADERRERMVEKAKYRLARGLPLKTGQAALLLGVDPRTVANWCRKHRIDGTQTPTGHWLVPASEVRRAMIGGAV
jgi:Helix-turn-helix domain